LQLTVEDLKKAKAQFELRQLPPPLYPDVAVKASIAAFATIFMLVGEAEKKRTSGMSNGKKYATTSLSCLSRCSLGQPTNSQ
jgi:hypothetical protein